jgi:F-type H+/Na+-transporting ATPase subunit alpha
MKTSNIFEDLKKQISDYQSDLNVDEAGRVVDVKDGVARVIGLTKAKLGEQVRVGSDNSGIVLSLEHGFIMVVILGDGDKVSEGDKVYGTGTLAGIGVGPELLGRVIDVLGNPLDGKGKISFEKLMPLEREAPGVIDRSPVNTSLATGLLAIDSLIPIGRGQRELIIGDRFTGKTAIAVDTIVNQRGQGVYCIYVAIGQKQSRVAQLVAQLEKHDALEYSVIVVASASDPAPKQMIAPFIGCTIGEYFRDRGEDALVVYDDLTKHAWAYRQISLSLRRPPGREAYPGDIFYLHSRLLERAAKMSKELGGGSLTALPIVETQGGDVSAYIPTNIISITDGQLYLDQDAFNAGNRPAVDVGLSVSRVGGAAQIKAMKQMSGQLRLDLAQYHDLIGFSQFGSDLDEDTKKKLARGKVMIELLKQNQFSVSTVTDQSITLFVGNKGFLDTIPADKIRSCVQKFIIHIRQKYPKIITTMETEKLFSDDTVNKLTKQCQDFFKKESYV